jgi:O-antigen/teichoic acid export membrane protein
VLAGSLWNGLNATLPQLYTLVQSVLAARVLGPVDMGRQSFIAWAAVTVKLLVTGGVPRTVVRFVADALGRGASDEARAVVRLAWRVEVVGATLATVALVAVAVARPELRLAWLLAAATCALTALHGVPYGALAGAQRWRGNAQVGLVIGGLATVATVVVLLAGGGITGMFAVEVVAAALSLGITAVRARRALAPDHDRRHARPVAPLTPRFARYAAAASVLIALEVVVWKRSEFFFLERYAGPADIAHYSVAFAAGAALAQLVEGLAGVVSPAIATLWAGGEHERVRVGLGRAWRLLTLATMPITAGAIAIGPAVLQLVYGDEYRSSGRVLVLLMVSFPLVPANLLGMAVLLGLGRLRLAAVAVVGAAVVDVGLSVWLIPGLASDGAAIANSVGQAVASVLTLTLALRLIGRFEAEPAALVRTVVVAAAAGLSARWIVVAPIGGLRVPAAVAAGIVVFGAGVLLLRAFPVRDLRWLEETAGHRLGGLVGRGAALALGGRS